VPLAVRDWGEREYASAHAEMRILRAARHRGEIPDTLLLVEHPPVITVGVQGDEGEAMPPGIPVVHVERGGKVTYHGPGQLVGYPLVDLEARGRDVRRFVRDVEEIVLRSVDEFGIRAQRVAGRRGVWVDGARKIASVGIAIEEWTTFHGFALNVNNDLAPFRSFHPCGFDGAVMTSMAQETGRDLRVEMLKDPVIRAFRVVFGGVVESRSPSPIRTAPTGPEASAVDAR
jgi:lipoyl(octanoyl) transferase